jgi:Tfp pilus assembly protein PilF
MADYSEALKIDPNNGLVQFRIGMVHLAANRVPQAEAAFHTAVQKDPNLADAWNDLAWLSAEKKTDLDMALTWAKKAVSIAPGEPRFTDTLAWVYRARKELNLAAQTLETFPARNQSPVLLYHLGLIELERGRKTEAAAALKQSLAGGSFAEAGDARKLLASLKP